MEANKVNEKVFDLGTVLTVTSGKVFTEIDNVYDILNHLSNDSIYTHQISRLMQVAQPWVLAKYPQLEGVGSDVIINNEQEAKMFVEKQKELFGNEFGLSPIPKELYQPIDPFEEMVSIRSEKSK